MAVEIVSVHLRFPKSLHKRLLKEAKANQVSLNREIVRQLEDGTAEQAARVHLLEELLRTAQNNITALERAHETEETRQADLKRRKASETPDD